MLLMSLILCVKLWTHGIIYILDFQFLIQTHFILNVYLTTVSFSCASVYIYMCSQRVDISAIVTTYLLCGVSIPFIFRRFPFATSFMRSWFLFLFGTPLMCSRMLFFLTTVLLILFLCSINRSCSSLNTQQSSGWILPD